jgi:guanylate kinase
MINNREMLEYAKVFDHYYGTPAAPVMAALGEGRDVLFDIDWQGTQQLADASREDLVSVFILPPSTRDLEKRLLSRAQDSADVVASRMAKASDEISHYREYDYILVNADLDQAVKEVRAILQAERLRRDRQIGLTDFVKRLRAGY